MRGNGKIFVSHTSEDSARCAPLLAALDAWGVDYWFDAERLAPGQQLSDRLQAAITERDIFMRICTAASSRSYWMSLEMNAFRGLQAEDQKQKRKDGRVSMNLVLDSGYTPTIADRSDIIIDGVNQSRRQMFEKLRSVLGLSAAPRAKTGISRRGAFGLGAAAVLTAGAITGGALLVREENGLPAVASYPKPKTVSFDGPTLDARVKWYFKAGDTDSLGIGLTLADGTLYAVTADGFYALDATDGSILWTNPQVLGDVHTIPRVVGDTIYLAISPALEGSLYAFKRTDGSPIWQKSTQSTVADYTIALAGTSIYMLADDGHVIAFSAKDGSTRWRTSTAISKPGINSNTPAADNNAVYIGASDGNMYALSATDGSMLWKYLTGGAISGTPTLAGNTIYFGSKDRHVYALNKADGTLLWRYNTGAEVTSSPTVAGDVAYIGPASDLLALDVHTGRLLWHARPGGADSFDFIGSQAVVSGDHIYVFAGAYLYALSASQKQSVWSFKTTNLYTVSSSTIATQDLVYFADGSHTLYALDALDALDATQP